MLDAMISIAEFFTPELPELDDEDPHDYYHFEQRADRIYLGGLREKHLTALRALKEEIKK